MPRHPSWPLFVARDSHYRRIGPFAVTEKQARSTLPKEAEPVYLSSKLCDGDLDEQRFDQSLRAKKSTSSLSSSSSTSYDLIPHIETGGATPKMQLLPFKRGNKYYRAIRWHALSTYRRLFTTVFACNLVALGVVLWHLVLAKDNPDDQRSRRTLATFLTAVSANLTTSIAIRNEHVINALFRLFVVNVSPKLPLRIRRQFAKVYCHGGVHSGCGVAATFWYAAYSVISAYDFITQGRPSSQRFTIVLSAIVWLLMLAIITAAHPAIRNRMHDYFEVTHRFCGWSVLGLFWVQTLYFCITDAKNRAVPTGLALAQLPTFWMLMVMTIFVIYPWIRLKRVKVTVEKLSSHAVRIHFTDNKPMPACRTIRIGQKPWKETHAFATIPEPAEQSGYSMVVSKAGDWTTKIINNPPTTLWIKGVPTWGVLRVATLFKPVIIVATGSGIGPCLGLFNGCPSLPCRVLWSTKDPEMTYGMDIVNIVRRADPNAKIINSSIFGRVDMVQMAYDLYKEAQAEGVIIISNPENTYRVVRGLESRGIPAYGPIWDS